MAGQKDGAAAPRKRSYKTREQLAAEAKAAKAAQREQAAEIEALKAQLAAQQSAESEAKAVLDNIEATVEQDLDGTLDWVTEEEAAHESAAQETNALLVEAVNMIRELAERQDAQAAEIERLRKRKTKTRVGTREDDKTIRNLTSRMVHVRLGNPKDPYRIELQPRGQSGDVADVPGTLAAHTAYKRNLGLIFEEISSDEAAAIRYGGGTAGQVPVQLPSGEWVMQDATISRDEDRTIARFDPVTGRPLDDRQQGGPIGPRYGMTPGADPLLTAAAAAVDPEYEAFQAWKASQGLAVPQQQVPQQGLGSQQTQGLLKRLNEAARSGDQEAAAMARRLNKMVEKGVIPAGELDKPVVVERTRESVQPIIPGALY